MPSGAKFAIQGFLYQFNKTLLEILNSDDATSVTIEGIVEDIDLKFEDGSVEAIQCKYHESRESYSPSLVYKPLLQMIEHFVSSELSNVKYKLFVHVSGDRSETRNIHECEIRSALTSAKSRRLKKNTDLTDFDEQAFAGVCVLEFGPSLDELRIDILEAFKSTSLPSDSVDTLFYPNAINLIANRSILQNDSCRTLTKAELLRVLEKIRKTAISRWTLALKTRQAVLRARRPQLKTNLSKNSRNRCLVLSQDLLAEFENEIVLFIQDFVAKYHFKPIHDKPPSFYLDCSPDLYVEICERLHQKGIRFTTGLEITGKFDKSFFFREPITRIFNNREVQTDIQIRITCHCDTHTALQHRGFDDIYVVCERRLEIWKQDVEVEYMPVTSFGQCKFLMGLSNAIE